ncbi:MAG: penicillin-binding protein 2 [Dehalococcoidia bacterium]|nr:penicillin-binding protein 2 [Dehalococcoidia bacterium]
MALVLLVSTGGLIARLFQLQVIEHGRYAREAYEEHYAERPTYATRGPILDRSGQPLAMSVEAWDIYVNRLVWESETQAAAESSSVLAPITGEEPSALVARVLNQANGELLVAEAIDYSVGLNVREQELTGVRFEPSSRRVYPEGDLASALIGFIGRDRIGLAGLEERYNETLQGTPGVTIYEQDSMGNQIAVGQLSVLEPEPGGSVVLTIDRGVQRAAERALDEAIAHYEAKGGSIIVMDPWTGEILALTSRPSIQLSALDFSSEEIVDLSRVRAVTDLYEPGSPFKLITMAAALDAGAVTPDTTYEDAGSYTWSDFTIRNWDGSANGIQTMTQVLEKSLNTGAIWAARTTGSQVFYDYLARFGFDQASGIDISGEAVGSYRLPDNPAWSPLDLATNSFGQGINVTPLQLINAVSAIANGGNLMQPYIIKEVHGPDGVVRTQPEVVHRAVSEWTSRTLRNMMTQVVDGISGQAGIPGYSIAGKTGTTSIFSSALGEYDLQRVIVSFTGIVPADDPRFVVLVKIDEPAGQAWGSTVAAPVFQRLAIEIVSLLNVPPDTAVVQRNEE